MNEKEKELLIGETFNNWEVIDISDNPCKMKCRCRCGTIKDVSIYGLLNNLTKSCGCIKTRKPKAKIQVNTTYNNFFILKDLGNDCKYGMKRHIWWCKCEICGKELQRSTYEITHTKSCGCLSKKTQFQNKHNEYDLSGDYGIGYTKEREEFWFDLEDYKKIKDYYWYIDRNGYVTTCIRENNQTKTIHMHKIIIDSSDDLIIDHIGHLKYDNRKEKLRITTRCRNCQNRIVTNSFGVTGVYQRSDSGKFCAKITCNHEIIHLGTFDILEDAIKARKKAEEKYFGEYSYDNSMKLYEEE